MPQKALAKCKQKSALMPNPKPAKFSWWQIQYCLTRLNFMFEPVVDSPSTMAKEPWKISGIEIF